MLDCVWKIKNNIHPEFCILCFSFPHEFKLEKKGASLFSESLVSLDEPSDRWSDWSQMKYLNSLLNAEITGDWDVSTCTMESIFHILTY